MEPKYDVFMSYRRIGGFETAKHISDLLVRDGYSVSFDLDTLRDGRFDTQLLSRIDECEDFIIIIDQHAFDRTLDPTFDPAMDWMRTELAYALRKEKHIIPVLLSGASFPDNLPEDIRQVIYHNRPEYSKEYFDAFYHKLTRFLHAAPMHARIDKKAATISLYTDTDCIVKETGRILAEVTVEEGTSITLPKGRHRLTFIKKDDPDVRYHLDYEVTDVEYCDTIDIAFKDIEEKDTDSAEENMSDDYADEKGSADRIIKLDDLSFRMVFVEGGVINGRIVDPFYIGQFPVTQNIWEHVMGNNPSSNQESEFFKAKKTVRRFGKVLAETALFLAAPIPTTIAKGGIDGLSKFLTKKNTDECGHYPVEMVNNFDAVKFVERLSELTGLFFSLPTEAEWQFAARGGRKSRGFKYAGSDIIDDVAWYGVNAGGITHPVGEKLPNELGLYDMSGNVWEWTLPESSRTGVRMGGSWSRNAEDCEVSHRDFLAHRERTSGSGLRVVLHDGKKGFNKK